jgi:hypothetical protein
MNALDREVLAITLMPSEELNKVSPQFHIWFETRTDRNLGQNSCESALFGSFKTLDRGETEVEDIRETERRIRPRPADDFQLMECDGSRSIESAASFEERTSDVRA